MTQPPLFEYFNEDGDSLTVFASDKSLEAPAEHPVRLAEMLLDMFEANQNIRIMGVRIEDDGITIDAKVISDDEAAQEDVPM